ncbi:MAG: hypothetical protein P9L94_19560 [Candidatus Hinthialibacter antarcticus]|nr:hypothetical protein [Candidatus Hinthialibacter antarcticus]
MQRDKHPKRLKILRSILSPKEFSAAINRSESSVKRWVDDGKIQAIKTIGGHRKISLEEAIRFVRSNKIQLENPEIFGFSDLRHVANEVWVPGTENDRFYAFLENGELEKARGYIMLLYLSGMSVAEICDNTIPYAMERIGELWKHNENGIGVEHRATDICINALSVFKAMFETKRNSPVVFGGAPSSDPYIVPSFLVATTLLSEGFAPINFGPNTPFEVFHTALKEHKPFMVWLSISYLKRGVSIKLDIKKLAEATEKCGAYLVIGGRFWESANLQSISDETQNVFFVNSMIELVALMKGLQSNR